MQILVSFTTVRKPTNAPVRAMIMVGSILNIPTVAKTTIENKSNPLDKNFGGSSNT